MNINEIVVKILDWPQHWNKQRISQFYHTVPIINLNNNKAKHTDYFTKIQIISKKINQDQHKDFGKWKLLNKFHKKKHSKGQPTLKEFH
jgi:hypothetical protein